MKIFIDTANIDEIKRAKELGIIDGVTTNPSLIAKEKADFKELILRICDIIDGPISVEVLSKDVGNMVKEAVNLARIHENIVVKIPMTEDGLKATRELANNGIKVNVTLIFSPLQALLAAKSGASYVSPFIGRLDDISHYGMGVIEKIADIFNNYGFESEIIVASIRNPLHVLESALIGADIATIPFRVIEQIIKHPLTDIGIERFSSDWEKFQKGIKEGGN
jgi:transaldolase